MPIKPHKDETQDHFMSRCVPEMIGTGPDKRPQDQAVAACLQIWRDSKKSLEDDAPEPDDDESEDDFLDRCSDQLSDDNPDADPDDIEEACRVAWENRGDNKSMRRKTHASEVAPGLEFILSDDSVDRMGDIITATGWEFNNFKKNPIALFGHSSAFPIGKWDNVRVDENKLKGRLVMAPEGTSPRIDEIRRLIDAGILKAVSVGFHALEHEAIDPKNPWNGTRFLKQELVECSLVSVPANPNALAIAKSLRVSPETIEMVFAKHGNKSQIYRRGLTGKHASRQNLRWKGSAMSLAQRISEVNIKLVGLKDELAAHWDGADQTNVTDADIEKSTRLNTEIGSLERQLSALMDSERLLGKSVAQQNGTSNGSGSGTRALSTVVLQQGAGDVKSPHVISTIKKELDPLDYFVRAGAVLAMGKGMGWSVEDARMRMYGDDQMTKDMCDLIIRSAVNPAMTTVSGWAAELVQQTYTDLMPLLMPKGILTRLAARGLSLSFGRFGRIIIPTRSRTPTIAGSFVGEGLAIPVRQGAFTSQTLTPKKCAVISTWTREMNDHSQPAIEGLIREAIQEDTQVAIDSVLLDANAATVIRPAGLLNGVAATTPTAGGGIAALVGDIGGLISALSTATYGNLRNPVWIANQTDLLRASLLSAANTGIFPFREEIARGTLNNIPIIDSATVTAKTLILVDAADFVVAGGEAPRMDVSDQATLHEEDTNPQPLVSGSPGTVAAPQRSLFQTDSMALRMVLPLNWVMRRTGVVAWTQNVTW